MPFASEIVMILFGTAIGFLSGVFPSRAVVHRRTFALNQETQFRVGMLWLVLLLLLSAVCLATDIDFLGWYFFGSLLAVGTAATILRQVYWRSDRLGGSSESAPLSYREEELTRVARFTPTLLSLFEPQSTVFSDRNALVCAALSSLAYRSKEEIERHGAEWHCATRFMESEDHLHSGFVIATNCAVFIAFRGTDQAGDWLTNAQVWHRETSWGTVHSGFLTAVDVLWPDLVDALHQLASPQHSLWLMGHSLGGAMAVLAAARLTQEKLAAVSGLYTFGQPMVGDARFRRNFDQSLGDKSFRVVTPRDEVPNQPAGFTHAGTLMYFDRNGALHRNPGWWSTLKDQIMRDSHGLVGEHSVDWYLQLTSRRLFPDTDPTRSSVAAWPTVSTGTIGGATLRRR